MSAKKKSAPPWKVGEEAWLEMAGRVVYVTVIEDRGKLAARGHQLLRVKTRGSGDEFEIPALRLHRRYGAVDGDKSNPLWLLGATEDEGKRELQALQDVLDAWGRLSPAGRRYLLDRLGGES